MSTTNSVSMSSKSTISDAEMCLTYKTNIFRLGRVTVKVAIGPWCRSSTAAEVKNLDEDEIKSLSSRTTSSMSRVHSVYRC